MNFEIPKPLKSEHEELHVAVSGELASCAPPTIVPCERATEQPKCVTEGPVADSLGQAVVVPHAPTNGWVRLYAPDQCFLGMGQILDGGRVAPKRMMIGAG